MDQNALQIQINAIMTAIAQLNAKVDANAAGLSSKMDSKMDNLQGLIINLTRDIKGTTDTLSAVEGRMSDLAISGKSKTTKATTAAPQPGQTPSTKGKNINILFKDLFAENRKKATDAFKLDSAWIEKLESESATIRAETDPKKRDKRLALELWSIYFRDPQKKSEAKVNYNEYLKKNGLLPPGSAPEAAVIPASLPGFSISTPNMYDGIITPPMPDFVNGLGSDLPSFSSN
jgi:hypothetical protein